MKRTVVAYSTTQTHEECVTFDLTCTLFVFEDGPARQKDFSLSYACQHMRRKGLARENEASTAADDFGLNNYQFNDAFPVAQFACHSTGKIIVKCETEKDVKVSGVGF
jgi:hypothetical protein